MKRRTLLKNAALGAASLALPRVNAADDFFKLNYILGSAMYGDLPLATVIEEAPKADAQFLDLWPRKWATHREQMDQMGHEKVAELLAKNGVKLAAITCYNLGAFKLADEMPVLKKFGGSILVVDAPGAKGIEGEALKKAIFDFVEKLKPHAEKAKEFGLTIAVENHVNSLIDSPDSLHWLAEADKEGRLGMELAPYHLPQDPALIAGLIKDFGNRIKVFCAWQYGMGCMKPMPKDEELMQMPGKGKLDFTPLIKALKDIKYTGFTEIFMHPTPRGIPILPTANEVTAEINNSRAYLEKCVADVGV